AAGGQRRARGGAAGPGGAGRDALRRQARVRAGRPRPRQRAGRAAGAGLPQLGGAARVARPGGPPPPPQRL
ncbi:MAG: hypothetical protein AVDCRST_MAG16-54, partial [uncultured Frankineae bacterium]